MRYLNKSFNVTVSYPEGEYERIFRKGVGTPEQAVSPAPRRKTGEKGQKCLNQLK